MDNELTYNDLFVEKYRPHEFYDVVLEKTVREFFDKIFSADNPVIPNLLFWGHPGGGKTTLAKIIRKKLGWQTLLLNASEENGIDDIRNKVVSFTETVSIDGNRKLVILEEADGLSNSSGMGSSAQELLKNLIESTSDRVRYILLVNDMGKINEAIKSRMQVFHIVPPYPNKDNKELAQYVLNVVEKEGIKFRDNSDFPKLISKFYPDIRKTLQVLQQYSNNDKHEFVFPDNVDSRVDVFAREIVKFLAEKNKDITDVDMMQLRKKIIDNERTFNSDYSILLKAMFEYVAKSSPSTPESCKIKRQMLLILGDGLSKHNLVVDKEINTFCAIIAIVECLK